MKKRCRKSGKVKYDTFETAWKCGGELITEVKNFKNTDAISAYRCQFCNKVHLTTKEHNKDKEL